MIDALLYFADKGMILWEKRHLIMLIPRSLSVSLGLLDIVVNFKPTISVLKVSRLAVVAMAFMSV
jgi:hypothetical protein